MHGFCGLLPQERCDDIDNDCDGIIDETHQCPNDQVCAAGSCALPCIAGECERSGQVCFEGGCVPDCRRRLSLLAMNAVMVNAGTHAAKVTCEQGEICQSGLCVSDRCSRSGCRPGERCVDDNCVTDQCVSLGCNDTQFCRQTADGAQCVESCATIACGFNEICQDGGCKRQPMLRHRLLKKESSVLTVPVTFSARASFVLMVKVVSKVNVNKNPV